MNIVTPSIYHNQQIHFEASKRSLKTAPTKIDKVEISEASRVDKPTKMLFALLKSALNGEPVEMTDFKGAELSDWKTLLQMSQDSSVSGIALDAYENLPKDTIPKPILMKMLKIQKEAEVRHAQQEQIIGELSELFAKEGIETVQLKGVALSMNYPNPTHRFGGDIDIFTRKKGTITSERSNTYERIDEIAKSLGCEIEDKITPKHSEFDYKGVSVENHRYFLNKGLVKHAEEIDEYLHGVLNPREQILPNGTKILIPSKEFESVFTAHHAWQHFVSGGIDIHHLTDWSTLVRKNGVIVPDVVKGTRFEKFIYAFTNLSNRYLGTDIKVPEDRALEDEIFNTLLHPDSQPKIEEKGPIDTIAFKTKRLFKRLQKQKRVCETPISKQLLDTVIFHLKKPSSIFKL